MKKYVFFVLVSFFMLTTSAFALNFVSPEDFKQWFESKKSIIILDIQPPDEYVKHHFKGSIVTNASPVKTEAQKKRLDAVIPNDNGITGRCGHNPLWREISQNRFL